MGFSLEYDQDGRRQQLNFDGGRVTVGREAGSDLHLDHPTVSRQHALITSDARGIRLVVLSKSGLTAVNGSPVQGEVDLMDGSQLHFGQLAFVFRANGRAAATGGFGQAGASGGFPQPGFGAQPGFGQPAGGGFGQPAGGGFGQPAGGAGFGQPAGGGFGNTPAGGFGSSGGFGQPAGGGGFGQPAGGGGGFGQPAGGGGFGQPAGGGGGGFGQPAGGGFGQPAGGGGFGQTGGAPAKTKAEEEHGIMSWDEIARSADEDKGGGGGGSATDFQRLEAASKKAEAQSKGSPLAIVGVVLIAAMLGFILYDPGPSGNVGGPEQPIEEQPPVRRGPNEVDCVGAAECKAKAEQNYKIGAQLLDKVEVDVQNRFEGYNRLLLAEEYLAKADITQMPSEFADLVTRRDKARAELDTMFRDLKVRYHSSSQRKNYSDMAEVLNQTMALFPHKGAREHIWALKNEREMKDAGNYPQTLR